MWVDIEDFYGNKLGPGPITTVTACRNESLLNKAGKWSFDMPVNDPMLEYIVLKNIAKVYQITNGEVELISVGYIDEINTTINKQGAVITTVSGLDMLYELTRPSVSGVLNTLYAVQNRTDAPKSLLSNFTGSVVPAWTLEKRQTTFPVVDIRFNHNSLLTALITIAKATGEQFRLGDNRTVEWLGNHSHFIDSGIVAVGNTLTYSEDAGDNICQILDFDATLDTWEIVNKLFVFGAGNAESRLTLAACTQWPDGSPISSTTWSDTFGDSWKIDKTNNTLENLTSQGIYGTYEKPVQFSEIAPISNEDLDIQAAANMLLSTAYSYARNKGKVNDYFKLSVTDIKKKLKPGEKIRVTLRRNAVGKRPINIDRVFNILSVSRNIKRGNLETNDLVISDVDRYPENDNQVVVDEISKTITMNTYPQMNMNLDTTNFTELMDEDTSAIYHFRLGPAITLVNQISLYFRIDPFQSPAKSVLSNSTTSGPSTRETSVTEPTAHGHPIYMTDNGGIPSGSVVYYDPSGLNTASSSPGTQAASVSVPHGHEMDHTHSVEADVSLEFGIFEDSTTYSFEELYFKINGNYYTVTPTTLTGGWLFLDLTDYFINDYYRPTSENNTIEFEAAIEGKRARIKGQLELRTVIQSIARV